jgi:hypothetical protein
MTQSVFVSGGPDAQLATRVSSMRYSVFGNEGKKGQLMKALGLELLN